MEIHGLSAEQLVIADLLWTCQAQEEVDEVIKVFGSKAQAMISMMIALSIDEDTEKKLQFPEIKQLLETYK